MDKELERSCHKEIGDHGKSLREGIQKFIEDKSGEIRAALTVFNSRVFNAVTSDNRLFQYRIGLDGTVSLNQIRSAPKKLLKARDELRRKATSHVRKTLTGDPNKRIRDHMKEVPQVKLIDKVSFTFGVMLIILIEFFMLRIPQYFPVFYYIAITILFTVRYFDYRREKFQFFMLDFCYFVNVSCIVQTLFFVNNETWFKINYTSTHGPLCIAVIVWHNSLVFHSIDKQTSFFLHIFPPFLLHLYRWKIIPVQFGESINSLSIVETLVYPSIFYLLWQVTWSIITEVIFHDLLAADLDLITSLRYLCRDPKNGAVKLFRKLLIRLGALAPDEDVDPEKMKIKLLFAVCQFIYNSISLLPVYIFYRDYFLTVCYILFIILCGVWNGASYYIEVFSKKYNLKFEMKRDTSSSNTETDEEIYISADEDSTDGQTEFVQTIQIELNNPLPIDVHNGIIENPTGHQKEE